MQKILDAAIYIVPTPIGNLKDITTRALEVLSEADIVACEDTRYAGILFNQLKIQKNKFVSYHILNEEERSKGLIDEVKRGNSIALISDAGTPTISDPGMRLVINAIDEGIKIVPLPGATAIIPALAASGLDISRFTFFGFPPHKKGRKTFVDEVCEHKYTTIMYESPHRILKLLKEIEERSDENRKICVAREISKIYEEFIRGNVKESIDYFEKKDKIKGEFVIVLEGKSEEKR